jgi:glycosyltransferase involved in cell wall biosynthesis
LSNSPSIRLSVLMPVYNESRTLDAIIARVLSAPVDAEIELICVDDASVDSSWQVLQTWADTDSRVKAFQHPVNRGKGAAIRTAISQMTGDIAVVQDSDLEYDPADFPKLIGPIVDGRADAVFGSRFAASPERRVLLYWHSLGNKLLTWLTNVLNDLNLTDMETCYKAISSNVLTDLRLESERFGIEPEITTRLAQWGARIYEVPISYHGRGYAEGKTIGWRDGVQAIWLLLKYRLFDTQFSNRRSQDAYESAPVAKAISRWTLEQFPIGAGDAVLEAGCGIGNFTRLLLNRPRLVAVDSDPYYARSVERRWGHLSNVKVLAGDLADAEFMAKFEGDFGSALLVNVLEHLDQPDGVVSNLAGALKSGGTLNVMVPAHRWLFGEVDRRIGHRQRFEGSQLAGLLQRAGLEVETIEEFNRIGVIGWWLNNALGTSGFRVWQMRLFVVALPLARLLERIRFLPGLSLIAIARKR